MTKLIKHEIPEDTSINITPLIDVVFQLLVFFVLTSSLARPTQIEMNLPESTSGVKTQETQKSIIITYRLAETAPVMTLNDQELGGFEDLGSSLVAMSAEAETPRVDLQIDSAVPYQDVIKLMDTVRDSGFAKFSLHTLAAYTSQKTE
ncbi:ExbD/TolR family protein [Verrucomicrobiota bacterium]